MGSANVDKTKPAKLLAYSVCDHETHISHSTSGTRSTKQAALIAILVLTSGGYIACQCPPAKPGPAFPLAAGFHFDD